MSDIRHTRHAALVGGLAALVMVQTAPAFAEAETPLKFTASQDVRHESNVFQSSKEFMRSKGYDKLSDTIYTTQAGLSFDKEYSRQGLHAELTVGRMTYSEYNEYNATSGNGLFNWDWQIGDRWSGVLGYSYGQSSVALGDWDSYSNKDSLKRRLSRGVASANYWFHPDWAVGARFSAVHNDYNDSDWNRWDEYEAVESNLDITYRPSTGNSIVLSLRNEEGEYKNQPKTEGYLSEWTQRDVRLSGSWQLTGVTRVSGYIGYGQREYEYASNRDFKGLIGSIAFHWAPSSKFYADVSWRREVGADADLISNFATTHVWTFRPVWLATEKVRIGARYEYRQRKFGGDPGYALPDHYQKLVNRDERWWAYGADIQYAPVNYFSISLGYEYSKRDSKYKNEHDRYDYDSDSAWLSGRFTF
jgi:hypothetical protein